MRTVLLFESYLQTLKDKFKEDILSHLYEINNEFAINSFYHRIWWPDSNIDLSSQNRDALIVRIRFKIEQIDLFEDVFHEGIFDRIKENFPKIEIKYFLYNFVSAQEGNTSIGYRCGKHSGYDEYDSLFEKIHEEIDQSKNTMSGMDTVGFTVEIAFN